MAGYSATPLPTKLGIKPGHAVVLVDAPSQAEGLLTPLPADVRLRGDLRGRDAFDVAVLFCRSEADLRRRFAGVAKRLTRDGGLWVAWPKKSSGLETDLSDSVVREFGLSTGMVDNKVCAIDETWSGLRFVVRLRDR